MLCHVEWSLCWSTNKPTIHINQSLFMFTSQFHGRLLDERDLSCLIAPCQFPRWLINNNCVPGNHACISWSTSEKQMRLVGCFILVIVLTQHLKSNRMLHNNHVLSKNVRCQNINIKKLEGNLWVFITLSNKMVDIWMRFGEQTYFSWKTLISLNFIVAYHLGCHDAQSYVHHTNKPVPSW